MKNTWNLVRFILVYVIYFLLLFSEVFLELPYCETFTMPELNWIKSNKERDLVLTTSLFFIATYVNFHIKIKPQCRQQSEKLYSISVLSDRGNAKHCPHLYYIYHTIFTWPPFYSDITLRVESSAQLVLLFSRLLAI